MRSAWRDGARVRTVDVEPGRDGTWRVSVEGAAFEVTVEPVGEGSLRLRSGSGTVVAEVSAAGSRRFVRLGALDFVLERTAGTRAAAAAQGGLEAPMPGVVTRVLVEPGDDVKKGQPLVALEAMKMEHLIRAPRDGRVRAVPASPGTMVPVGTALIELEPETTA